MNIKIGDIVKAKKGGHIIVGKVVRFPRRKYEGAPQLTTLKDEYKETFNVIKARCVKISKNEAIQINKQYQ